MACFLVIDDDSTIRELIVYALEHAGHEAIEASSGREGAMLFQNRRPDIIITDLVMPADSLECVLELSQLRPGIPFILVSGLGHDAPRTLEVAAALRARHILAKPFKLDQLLNVTDAVLTQENITPLASRRK